MKFLLIAALLIPFSASASLSLDSKGKDRNFLYENDRKALASSVQFVFQSGSLSDPKGKEGLASISFQMLLRGTKSMSRKEFDTALERLGGSISVDVASNRSIVFLDVISENLPEALKLLSRAVEQPGLKESELKSLVDEELAGLHQELSNNRAIMQRAFQKALFRGTGLEVPPDGKMESLKAITIDDVKDFLSTHIKSGNTIVAVNSNHPQGEVESWLKGAFSDFPEGAAPKHPVPELKNPEGRVLYLVERKGSSTTEVGIGQLGIKAGDPDREVLETGLFTLGGDMSSRLFQILRAQNGWTYGAYASFQMLEIPRRHGGSFMIYAFPQSQHTAQATLKGLEIFEDFLKKGVTAGELDFAKKSLINSYPFKFATSRSRLTAKLYERLDGAPRLEVPAYRKLVNGISRKSLLAALKKTMDAKNLIFVLVGDPEQISPMKDSIPGLKETIVIKDPKEFY